MLLTSTVLERKPVKLDLTPCAITAAVCLKANEYRYFENNLLQNHEFLSEYTDLCGGSGDICRCLLVLNEESDDGILCHIEGYSYARYAAPFPGAKVYLNHHLQGIANQMIEEAVKNSPDGMWVFDYEDFEGATGIALPRSTFLLNLFQEKLLAREEISSVFVGIEGITVSLEPAFCQSQSEEKQESSIDIMWDDLKPATQQRIIKMLGENGNYDIYPITTIYAEPSQGIQM